MTKNFSLLLLLISIYSFAQIKYKQGYFISNDGVKTDCFIRDMAWKDYPEDFSYKKSLDGESQRAGISNVKEFSVDETKFVRFNIKLDDSPVSLNSLNYSRNPVWIYKTAFLKLLVDGETQLYKYSSGGNKKYFIKKRNNDGVEQLIYKKYLVDGKDQTSIQLNNTFRKQLDSINPNFKTSTLQYDDVSLINVFTPDSTDQKDQRTIEEKGKLNIIAKIGALISSSNSVKNSESIFESKTTISPAVEFEYVFAFNKNKWSVFAEFAYRNISSSKHVQTQFSYSFTNNRLYELNNKSIMIPMGIKHYLFLNDNNKIFVGAAIMSSVILNAEFKESDPTTGTVYYNDSEKGFTILSGYQFGLGYVYKNRFSLEGKVSSDTSFNSLDGTFFTVGIGYNIF